MSSGKTIGLIKALGGTGGGGGGTSNAVQYIPQELTESQQMQARKNLGVYYTQRDFVEVLPLMKVIPQDAAPLGYGLEIPGFEIIPEKRYSVNINGELFVATPNQVEFGGSKIYVLGSRFDESSMTFVWDYPFAIMQLPYNPDLNGIYFQNAGEREISIAEEGVVYHSIPPEYLPSDIEIIANFDDGTFAASITFEEAWQMSPAELNRRIALYNSEETKAELQGYSPTSVSKAAIRSIGNHIIIEVNGPYAESSTTYRYGDEPMVLCWSESGVSIMTKAV